MCAFPFPSLFAKCLTLLIHLDFNTLSNIWHGIPNENLQFLDPTVTIVLFDPRIFLSVLFSNSLIFGSPFKVKGKILHRTGHEGPEGEYRYSSTLSWTLALDGVGGQIHAPAALPPGRRPGTHCIGGWVGPRAGLDGCETLAPIRIRSPDRPACSESLYRPSYPGPLSL